MDEEKGHSPPENQEAPAPAEAPDDAAIRLPGDVTESHQHGQALPNIPAGTLTAAEDARRYELLGAAIKYAGLGYRVIPVRWITREGVCSCHRGEECMSPGKHPVHDRWQMLGTDKVEVVSRWWRQDPEGPLAEDWFPLANIGIVTGPGIDGSRGTFVLDVDPPEGEVTLAGYESRFRQLMPLTRIHSSGSGGTHYFFTWPDFDVHNSAKRVLGPGLDIRGKNGFVVAPPSVSMKGEYEVAPAHEVDMSPAPEWLLEVLRSWDRGQKGQMVAGAEPVAGTGITRRYAEAAVREEAERMRHAQPGERNDTLNSCAFSLGTLGGAGLLTEETAYEALLDAARAAGLMDAEIRGTFLSGWRAGLQEPRNIPWNAMGGDWPLRAWTELGMADRMADHFGDSVRWCPEWKAWMVYAGGCWQRDFADTGQWYAQQMIRRLPETEGRMYDDQEHRDSAGDIVPSPRAEFLAWLAKQQTRKAVGSAAELAKGLPLMRIRTDSFDPDPLLLNCLNGAVDIRTGELVPHHPEQRMTLQCPVSFMPGATAPRWQEFLDQVQPDGDKREYFQRLIGYAATGMTSEQIMALMHGAGRNGKSVAMDVIAHCLGSYAQSVPVETLILTQTEGRVPNDVARMVGRRLLQASETRAGKQLDEALIKQMTGGDTISARFMRSEFFDLKIIGKIFLTTNHLPVMSDDPATQRRIRLITWPVQIAQEDADPNLTSYLIQNEAEGIFWWIVQGALAWYREGLNEPDVVKRETAEYFREEDVIGQFIEEQLEVLPQSQWGRDRAGGSVREIFAAYTWWAEQNGMAAKLTQPMLTKRLKRHYHYERGNGWAGFVDLKVRSQQA